MAEPFDMSLVQRGARNRRTPYYEATQKYGPTGFTVYNHMYFPIRFDSFEAEFETLLNDVTLWDVSVERCLEISGPDGFRFAQLLTPRDLSTCAVGQAKYVLICDADGGIINDPVLTRMDENTFWFALASSDALLFARGLRNAYPDLDVTIQEADVAPLQVQGPKSKDLMVSLLGEQILDLRYYFWTEAKIAGVPVVVTRTGWTSEIGYEVYTTDTSRGNEVYEAIMEAGAAFGIKPTGPSDIRRIEGAIFNWGADMTYENNAFQMGLERLVDLDSLTDDASLSIGAYRRIRSEGVVERINGRHVRRRALPGPERREVAGEPGRRVRREGDVRDPLTEAQPEHRLLLVAVGAERRGTDRARRDRVGDALGHGDTDAVRGPLEADPGVLRHPQPEGGSADGERARGDAREERHVVLRPLVPAVAVLQVDAPRRLHGVRHLQPHVPARVLRRSRDRVPPPERGRHPVGRRCGTHGPGQRPRRGPPDRHVDLS